MSTRLCLVLPALSIRSVVALSVLSLSASALTAVMSAPGASARPSAGAPPAVVAVPDESAGQVLLEDRTTETSSTWLLPDGALSTEVYQVPVNFQDSAGQWQEIDSELVDSPAAGVAVENAANDFTVQLPQDASAKPVRFSADGAWVSFGMRGLDGAPAVDGAAATYADAGDAQADSVVYEATASGVKESIVLNSAPTEAVVFEFDLDMSGGLNPVLRPTGEIVAVDAAGVEVFWLPAPFMVDSADPQPAVSPAVTYALDVTEAGWLLTVAPDLGWLQDPARVYPVLVDPTVIDQKPVSDCFMSAHTATTSYCGALYLKAGRYQGYSRRALVKFPLAQVPSNATVTSATLWMYLDATQSTTGLSAEHWVRRIAASTPWTSAATWNKRDATTSWAAPGGDVTGVGDTGNTLSGTVSGNKAFDVTTAVSDWVGGATNNGMLLKQRTETVDNLLSFASSNSTDPSQWPQLNVAYTEPTPPAASEAGDRKFFTYTDEKLSDRIGAKVNVGNGNLLVSANDANVAGVAGLNLTLNRTYNSALSSFTDPAKVGAGWSHNLGGSVRLEFPNNDDKRIYFHGPSGYRVRFEKNPAGDYIRYAPGLEGNLRKDTSSNTLRVEMHSKQVYVFKPFTDAAKGQLNEVRDKQGNNITFAYNTDGTLATATDTRGRTAVFTYRAAPPTSDGMLGSIDIRTPGGTSLVTYTYDYTATTPARLATTKVDAVNTTLLTDTTDTTDVDLLTSYAYDTNGRLSQVKDARENDPSSNGTLGGTTTVEYDTAGKVYKLNRLTDDTGQPDSTSTYTYGTTLPSDCASEGTHFSVVNGERLSTDVTDTTTYCADAHDRVQRVIDAKGHVRKNTFTANSNVATFDGSGLATGGSSFSSTYDSNDNPTSTTTPTGGTASAQYEDTTNPNFPTSTRDFDTGGSTSQPATWSYDYDDDGNLIEAAAAVSSGKNIKYRYCWDGNGQLQRIDPIDAAGNQSTTLDTSLTAGCGTATPGNDTLYTYDGDDQLLSIDPPGTHRTQTYTYDALSRVKTVTDGRGMVVTYSYDAQDRVVEETFDATSVTPLSGPTTSTVTWDYDPAGNMVDMTDPTGPTTFDYDELNRTTGESQQAPAATKTYRYDPADNLLEAEVSDEPEATKYAYDSVNLVTSVDDQRTGANVVTYAYDRHDKRTKTTFPMPGGNNVLQRATYGDGGQIKCMYSYRANTVPTGAGDDLCPAATAANLLSFASYSYTKTGTSIDTNTRYTATDKGGGTTTYTYDPIKRLSSATTKAGNGTSTLRTFTYDYDRHSNLVKDITSGTTPQLVTGTTTLAYNDSEELCWTVNGTSANTCASPPTGSTTYTHDGAGALASASNGLALAYNAIGQTASIDPAGAIGAVPMEYQGVTQDRRITKDTLEMSYGFSGLSSQATNSGVPHAEWFVRDPGGKLIAQVDRNTTEPDKYYLTDAQDTVIATIDTTGAVRRYIYEPYGQQIRTWIDTNPTNNTTGASTPPDGSNTTTGLTDDPADINPWRYASGYYDTETQMLKYGTRYYMPNLGRWTQVDPQAGKPAQPMSLNPYLYTENNPTNRTDPTGRYWGEDTIEDAWDGLTDWDLDYSLEEAVQAYTGMELMLGGLTIITTGVALATLGAPLIAPVIGGYALATAGVGVSAYGFYLVCDASEGC